MASHLNQGSWLSYEDPFAYPFDAYEFIAKIQTVAQDTTTPLAILGVHIHDDTNAFAVRVASIDCDSRQSASKPSTSRTVRFTVRRAPQVQAFVMAFFFLGWILTLTMVLNAFRLWPPDDVKLPLLTAASGVVVLLVLRLLAGSMGGVGVCFLLGAFGDLDCLVV